MSTKVNTKNKSTRRASGKHGIYYSRLSSTELDGVTKPFDQEFVPSKPLTASMRKQDERAKRKRGRPVIGEGSEKVLVTLEKGLLRDADKYAKRLGRNRSNLIADGLRAIIYPSEAPTRRRTPRAA